MERFLLTFIKGFLKYKIKIQGSRKMEFFWRMRGSRAAIQF
jgi:hypothetical protein